MSPTGAGDRSAVPPDSSAATLIRLEAYGVELTIMAIDDIGAQTSSPLDLIFSCTICQATAAQLYAEDGSSRALPSTADLNNGVITKLWLTECAHLTCGKHLDGGGKFISTT